MSDPFQFEEEFWDIMEVYNVTDDFLWPIIQREVDIVYCQLQ